MDRLTEVDAHGIARSHKSGSSFCSNYCTNCGSRNSCDHINKCLFRVAEYEAINLTPAQIIEALTELEQYRKAQDEGRLVDLPDNFKQLCDALGDSIWHLMVDGEITESTLTNICFDDNAMLCLEFGGCGYRWDVPISTFGKTVFLTYAEAKAALKG